MPNPSPPDANPFRALFTNWPESLPRRGVVVSTLNEATPFKGFLLKDDMLVLERQNPDTLGARFVLMPYEGIAAVKLVDPLKAEAFTPLGFSGTLSV